MAGVSVAGRVGSPAADAELRPGMSHHREAGITVYPQVDPFALLEAETERIMGINSQARQME